MGLEPLPETHDALRSIGAWSEHDLVDELTRAARLVEKVVPTCVGLSVSLVHEGLTFTMISSSPKIATLDGVQYAVGGPCVDAVDDDVTLTGGHHEALAAIMGAWAPGAVRDADLEFSTRNVARQAPQHIEDRAVLDQAAGVVMAERGVDEETARGVLAQAAGRAGIPEIEVARAVILPLESRTDA